MSFAVVIAVGPRNLANTLDTIASLVHFCPPDCQIILVDDCTTDGTHDALRALIDPRLLVLRNERPQGYAHLVQTTALGLRAAAKIPGLRFVLKTDTDALMTGPGLFDNAAEFAGKNPRVGIFGRHLTNYDGTEKSYAVHTEFLQRESRFSRRYIPGRTGYFFILKRALANGWSLGENVFGGGYFLTAECLHKMVELGYLETAPWHRTVIAEDTYFTMCAVAAGFERAQFAMPVAPLALAFDGLPEPARILAEKGMKLIHSVDKGRNTSRAENEGLTPREFFAQLRK